MKKTYLLLILLILATYSAWGLSNCTETDGGKDYAVPGYTEGTGYWEGSIYYVDGKHSDKCEDSWTLSEYYCYNTLSYRIDKYSCPKLCRGDKCIIEDLSVACPSVPCEFKGNAINMSWRYPYYPADKYVYDSPPDFISAQYPYEFNLDADTSIKMTFIYDLWSDTPSGTNKIYVKVDGIEVYQKAFPSTEFTSDVKKHTVSFDLGKKEKGKHLIEINAEKSRFKVVFGFILEKIDDEEINQTLPPEQNETIQLNETLEQNETEPHEENETLPPELNETLPPYQNETLPPEQNETIQLNETIEKNETQPPQQNETETPSEEPPINGGCPPDKVLICHKNKNDLCVAQPAVATHLNHGDYEGSCANEKTDTKEIINVKANEKVNLEFNNSVKVSFKSLNEQQDSIVITARVRDVPPQDTPPPIRKVKEYLIIDHPDIDNSEIADSTVEFTISEDWLIENNAKKESVILSKYIDNYWKDLRTKYTKSVNNVHYYEAESEGFSTFAITLNNTVAPVKEMEETEQTPIGEGKIPVTEKEDMTSKFLTLPYLIGASIIVLFFVFVLLMPPPKKKQETTDPEKEKYKDVIEFIAELKKKNKSQDEIETELSNAAWSKEDIKKLLKLTSEKNK